MGVAMARKRFTILRSTSERFPSDKDQCYAFTSYEMLAGNAVLPEKENRSAQSRKKHNHYLPFVVHYSVKRKKKQEIKVSKYINDTFRRVHLT